MAFENLTLFEFRFEDAQFGPRTMGTAEADEEKEETVAPADDEGRSPLATLVVLGLAAAGAWLLWRRFSAEESEVDIHYEEDKEKATADDEPVESDFTAAE